MNNPALLPCRHCGKTPELFKADICGQPHYRFACVTEHTPFLFCPAWMRWAPLMATLEEAASWWNVENSKVDP